MSGPPTQRPSAGDEHGEEEATDWVSVLDTGLPALPSGLEVGDEVATARWIGTRYAAVSWTARYLDDDGADEVSDDVTLFVRTPEGWLELGSSGAAGLLADNPQPLGRQVAADGQARLFPSGGAGSCVAFEGAAGPDARWLEVVDVDGRTRMPIESPVGRVVACAEGSGPFAVRVLDDRGGVLFEHIAARLT